MLVTMNDVLIPAKEGGYGVGFFNAVTLFFIGLLGEYVLSMNKRLMHRPLVIEEKRLNFDEEEKKR